MHMEKKKKQSLGYSTLVILQQMTLPMYLNTTHVSSTGKRKKKERNPVSHSSHSNISVADCMPTNLSTTVHP